MGAHNAATLAAARERIAYVAERLNAQSLWRETFDSIVASEPHQMTLRKWASEGQELNALQVHVKLESGAPIGLANAWSPGARIVDAVRSTFIEFGTGSRRDFAGLVCYAATDDYWVGFSSWGSDTMELVVYRRES